jgi:hypothetical protein
LGAIGGVHKRLTKSASRQRVSSAGALWAGALVEGDRRLDS